MPDLSNCCHAPVKIQSDVEIDYFVSHVWHKCSKCGNECSIVNLDPELEERPDVEEFAKVLFKEWTCEVKDFENCFERNDWIRVAEAAIEWCKEHLNG